MKALGNPHGRNVPYAPASSRRSSPGPRTSDRAGDAEDRAGGARSVTRGSPRATSG
jgi:hypothetical protein